MQQTEGILTIKNLSVNYGTLNVLHEINFSVSRGEVLGIMGQNGSGKSTLLKSMYGILKPKSGNIFFNNRDITDLKPNEIQKKGIAYCLQGGMIFPKLSVAEHLKIADPKKLKMELVYMQFPEIKNILKKRAGNLSGGQRQMLSLAMLLVQDATLWLLDEPSAGLSAQNAKRILSFLQQIKQLNTKTIIIVEHNYNFAFSLIDKAIIIKNGKASEKLEKTDFESQDFLTNNLYL